VFPVLAAPNGDAGLAPNRPDVAPDPKVLV